MEIFICNIHRGEMAPTDLYDLIMSDDVARQLATRGDDEACAKQCVKIAPVVQTDLAARDVQYVLSLRKKWGVIRHIATDALSDVSSRQICLQVTDWVDKNYSVDVTQPEIQELFLELVSKQILSNEDVQALVQKSYTAQRITTEDVSTAMRPYRPGGKI